MVISSFVTRQCGVVAACALPKRVWKPELAAVLAKVLAEEALPVQELAHNGLAARNVCIHLHPRATDLQVCSYTTHILMSYVLDVSGVTHRQEGAPIHSRCDSLEQCWVAFLEPRVLLRRAGTELVGWVAARLYERDRA